MSDVAATDGGSVSDAERPRRPLGGDHGGRARVRSVVVANQWLLLLLVIVGLGAATGLVNPRFLSELNLRNILEQSAVLGLVAAGATVLIISGNFDISVGAIIGLSATSMAMLVLRGVPEPLAMVVGIGLCILCSVANAVLARLFRAPTFIVSLATAGVFAGTALALTGAIIQLVPTNFTFFSGNRVAGIPLTFLVSLLGFVVVGLILRFTRVGRRTYAIGDNPRAAFLAGIDVSRSTVMLFALNGLLIGVASIVLISRIGSAEATTGAGLELRAIGAVVIGGVPITGGRGGVVGTFLGVLLLGVISNMLNLLRINPLLEDVAFGTLIVLAIGVSAIRSRLETAR